MSLDEAYERVAAIFEEAKANAGDIRTEEDAKIRIITRVLTDCLGWSYSDIQAERAHENGFSDYLLAQGDTNFFLIEAKRVGVCDIGTAEPGRVRYLKISGIGLAGVTTGIEQAASYATPHGLPFAVVTDGLAWIVFKTFIPGEHYKNKQAIVFPSSEAVLADFQLFFELLGKQGYGKRLYTAIFDRVHEPRLLLSRSLETAVTEHENKINQKSDLAYELDRIFEAFFSRLGGDQDDDMLVECFVETRESRFADFALEKMTASVLGNLSPVDKDVDTELSALIETIADVQADDVDSGQTVFIVGPTGAGKTTFLERFFKKTLSEALRKRCIAIRLNCLDSTGRPEALLPWMIEELIRGFEAKLYEEGLPTFAELQGLYHSEYLRRARGADAQLYKRDKEAFKEKFGQYLSQVVDEDREGYLKRILTDVVNNRHLLPVLVIDNTDEFSIEFKTTIFQFSQSLRRHAKHCVLMFPVTDKSAWSFSKTDIFGIYQSRSFFLPTPPPREVFRKRINYLKVRLKEIEAVPERGEYFSQRGIRISIGNLSAFAKILEDVFVDQEHTASTLGELTNFNIRRTLALSRRVITSAVFRIEDLVKSYVTGTELTTSFAKFMNALMRGDMDVYRRGDGNEIYPLFDVDSEIVQSPLLSLRILTLLRSVKEASRSIDERHLSVRSIMEYFTALGCHESSIERSLSALLESNLLEPYDPSKRDLSPDQRLAVSFSGLVHVRLGVYNGVFCEQMALTTPLTNPEVAANIRSHYRARGDHLERMGEIRKAFLSYLLEEDRRYISDQASSPQYASQEALLSDVRHAAEGREPHQDSAPAVLTEVRGVVDWYDREKGYGFVEVPEQDVDGDVFLHGDRLEESGFEEISDGDEIICDIQRGKRGWSVLQVHDVRTDPESVETLECVIIRLFPERQYGFVALGDGMRTAFFHFSIIPEALRPQLAVRGRLLADVGSDNDGRLQVRRLVKFLPH